MHQYDLEFWVNPCTGNERGPLKNDFKTTFSNAAPQLWFPRRPHARCLPAAQPRRSLPSPTSIAPELQQRVGPVARGLLCPLLSAPLAREDHGCVRGRGRGRDGRDHHGRGRHGRGDVRGGVHDEHWLPGIRWGLPASFDTLVRRLCHRCCGRSNPKLPPTRR